MNPPALETSISDPSPALSSDRSRAVGVGLLITTAVFWSLSGVAVKIAHISPVTFTFYRSLGATAAMGIACFFVRGAMPNVRWMILSAALYTAVVLTLITAMTVSTAATGILLQYTGPVFCALLAWIFQRRRIARRTAVAMLIASTGIVILIAGQPRGGGWLGPVCGTASGLAFGALILVLEKIDRVSSGKANPVQIVLFNNLGCALLLFPVAIHWHHLAIQNWQLSLVATTGVVQLALPYILFQLALRRVPPVDASLLTLLEPVLNPVWVAMATNEYPNRTIVVGGMCVVIALVLESTKPR